MELLPITATSKFGDRVDFFLQIAINLVFWFMLSFLIALGVAYGLRVGL